MLGSGRFRVFEPLDTSPAGREVTATNGVRIRWTVRLANRKDAVVRCPSQPITERPQQPPPPLPQLDPSRANRVIAADGVAPNLGGGSVVLRGTYLTGTAFEIAGHNSPSCAAMPTAVSSSSAHPASVAHRKARALALKNRAAASTPTTDGSTTSATVKSRRRSFVRVPHQNAPNLPG